MVRVIGFFVGLAFAGVLLISLINGVAQSIANPAAATAESKFHEEPKHLALASDGAFGHFDRQQVQRGLQVYKEVCSACHSLKLVAFRDLAGLGYTDPEIKAFAKQWNVPDINPDTGEPNTRKGIPSDHFPAPFANETAARAANNNAVPPDLSLITKAREGGAAYVYSLLTGYQNQPADLLKQFPTVKTPPNLHYNPYFANLNLAMPPPLTSNGQVTYGPGNPPATVDQMAKDVAAFLVWTAEPKLENRHEAGIAIVVFLLVGAALGYFAARQIWAEAKRTVRVTGPLKPESKAKTRRAKAKAGVAG